MTHQYERWVHIRWMKRRDMKAVLDIDNSSFPHPWTEGDYIRTLRQKNCIGMVAEEGKRVVGTMTYELHPEKLGVLRFAVHAECRRGQVGKQMLCKLIAKLSPGHRTHLTIDVRESNLSAQQFFRAVGFRATEIVGDVFDDEDAYRFAYDVRPDTYTPTNRIARHYA